MRTGQYTAVSSRPCTQLLGSAYQGHTQELASPQHSISGASLLPPRNGRNPVHCMGANECRIDQVIKPF